MYSFKMYEVSNLYYTLHYTLHILLLYFNLFLDEKKKLLILKSTDESLLDTDDRVVHTSTKGPQFQELILPDLSNSGNYFSCIFY